jgi:hypothetical protein
MLREFESWFKDKNNDKYRDGGLVGQRTMKMEMSGDRGFLLLVVSIITANVR